MSDEFGLTEEDRAVHNILCFAETLYHGKDIDLPLPTGYMRELASHLEKNKGLVNDSNLQSVKNVAALLEGTPAAHEGAGEVNEAHKKLIEALCSGKDPDEGLFKMMAAVVIAITHDMKDLVGETLPTVSQTDLILLGMMYLADNDLPFDEYTFHDNISDALLDRSVEVGINRLVTVPHDDPQFVTDMKLVGELVRSGGLRAIRQRILNDWPLLERARKFAGGNGDQPAIVVRKA